MKKIYTKSVFEFNKLTNKYQLNESESEFYLLPADAPIAQMKGGGTIAKTQNPMVKRGLGAAEQAFMDSSDFSPETLETNDMIFNQGRAGAPLATANNDLLQKTINGEFLTGGKGFDAALDAAKNKILPSINSSFAKSGRSGSGLADVAKTGALGDVFAGQYAQERQNQINAGNQATANQNANLNAMGKVGDNKQNARRNAIMNYLKTVGGDFSNLDSDEPMAQWLKTLLATGGGAAQGYASTGSPWGAAAGGAAGAAGSFV